MKDAKSPENQAYINEKLQEQLEQITERIILRHINSFYKSDCADIEFYTGLSREKIEEIADKCRRKLLIQQAYSAESLLEDVKYFCEYLKTENSSNELASAEFHVSQECAVEWRREPKRSAVRELVYHQVDERDIMKSLRLTEDEFYQLMPEADDLKTYEPVFQPKELAGQELEEKYQKMMQMLKGRNV